MQRVDMGYFLQLYLFSFVFNIAYFLLLILVLPRKMDLKRGMLIIILYSQLQPIADSLFSVMFGGRYVEYTAVWYVIVKLVTILEMILPVFFIKQTTRIAWYKAFWIFILFQMTLIPSYQIYFNYFVDINSYDTYRYRPIDLDNVWIYLLVLLLIVLLTTLFVLLLRKLQIHKQIEKVPNIAWVLLNTCFLIMILILEKHYFDNDPGIDGIDNYRVLTIIFVLIVLFLMFVINFAERRLLKLENQLLRKQNALQYESFLSKQENDLELQKLYLNIGNHLKTIQLLVEEGDDQKVSTYAEDVLHTYQSISPKKYCTNQIINAVLLEKMARCEELQISTELEVRLPEELAIRDIDLMCVLSNLLDNAIECCNRQQTGQRYIKLKATLQNQNCIFYVVNSHDLDPTKAINENGRTWKKDKSMHGYGQKIIKEITERYQGYMDVKLTQDEYQALVILK